MDQWYSAATTIQNKFSNVKADQFKMPRRLKYTLLSLVWGGNISIGTIVPMIVFENHTQLNWSYAAFYSFNGAITAAYFFVVLYTTGRLIKVCTPGDGTPLTEDLAAVLRKVSLFLFFVRLLSLSHHAFPFCAAQDRVPVLVCVLDLHYHHIFPPLDGIHGVVN